jgi:hypothetical protein
MERRFEMSWDGGLTASTVIFVLVMVGVGVGVGWVALSAAEGDPLGTALGLAGPLAVLAIAPVAWALGPRALSIDGGVLRVERRLRPVEIPLAEIRSVALLPREATRGVARVGGSSGVFGHYGRFWSRKLGPFRLYATRTTGHVLLDTDGGRFLLTPDRPEAFVAALRSAAPAVRPLAELTPAAGGRGTWKVLVVVLAAALLVGPVILLVAWGWAPSSVRLDGQEVVVERNWAGPLSIPVAPGHARPLQPAELRGLRRVAGTALGEVRYGRFRSAALGSFQLYAPRWGPAFLLETDDGPVVVVPDDPVAFEEGIDGR